MFRNYAKRHLTIALLLMTPAVLGGGFELSWTTLDGGGTTTATGGGFELCGTIGQPDAGWTLAGGAYSLTGGFWVGGETSTPPVCRGDSNCDGVVSWRDIDYFVAAMNDNVFAWEEMFKPYPPTCLFASNDVNKDGTVSWRDIDPLVAVMNTICP